jgi:hypothetical protein
MIPSHSSSPDRDSLSRTFLFTFRGFVGPYLQKNIVIYSRITVSSCSKTISKFIRKHWNENDEISRDMERMGGKGGGPKQKTVTKLKLKIMRAATGVGETL